jgi:hypothetical protein
MMDERAEALSVQAEWLNAAIDRLLAERRPEPAMTAAEAELLHTVVLLRQVGPDLATPSPAFTAKIRRRLQHPQTTLSRAVARQGRLAALVRRVRARV